MTDNADRIKELFELADRSVPIKEMSHEQLAALVDEHERTNILAASVLSKVLTHIQSLSGRLSMVEGLLYSLASAASATLDKATAEAPEAKQPVAPGQYL